MEDETENIMITFKGCRINNSISLWENMIAIRVRLNVAPVKQYYKCFRYGHIKTSCRSEERCIICDEEAHGICNRQIQCRNCGGNHRSSYRRCAIYEKNKNIQTIMVYNNVSYASAIRILEGREKEPEPAYDRYNEAEKWPKLPPIGNKLPYQDTRGEKESERERRRKEERRSRNETRVRVNTEQENRNRKEVWRKNDQAHQRKEILNRK